jgi:GT2 family glycosyltransferase
MMDVVMLWYQHDWGLYGRRYEMIARTWARVRPGDRVLVVEPPFNPWIWFREISQALRQGDRALAAYWLRRLPRLACPLVRRDDRLWVLQPFFPWPFRSTGRGRLTRFSYGLAWAMAKAFLRLRGWKTPILWAYPPHGFVRFAAERWTGRLCVDLVDDNTQYGRLPGPLKKDYEEAYGAVVDRAEAVFSVAKIPATDRRSRGRAVTHVPNAAPDPEVFLAGGGQRSREEGKGAAPRVGYVGRLDERIDWTALETTVRDHPRARFVFMGPVEPSVRSSWARLAAFPNVEYRGTVPHERLAAALSALDICLLPHRVTPLTESMDPLKLYLYLAAGKPVAALGARVEPSLASWVKRAEGPADFSRLVGDLLDRKGPEAPLRPDMSAHTWPDRVARMAARLEAPPEWDVVVSIVHYNTPDILRQGLASFLAEGSPLRVKIVVVDNASTPPLSPRDLEAFPGVELLSNARNTGFGRANNQVFRRWRGRFHLVTNPDVRVPRGGLASLVGALESDPSLGAVGAGLSYADGRPQTSCRRYPTLRSVLLRGFLSEEKAARFAPIRRYLMEGQALDRPRPADWLLGSCLLIRREALDAVEGFDEGFFMYYEDIDLCYRLNAAGRPVQYRPEVRWVHDYRRESAGKGRLKLRAVHFMSAMRFLAKHLPRRGLLGSF